MIKSIINNVEQFIPLIKYISGVYLFSIILGGILNKFKPSIIETFEKTEEQKYKKEEKIFGQFQKGLKKGKSKTLLTCMVMLFIVNLFGVITTFTIGSIFLLPLLYIFVDGMRRGASIFPIQGSSFLSIVFFYFLVFVKWIAHIIAIAAGLNVFLSVVEAFKTQSVAFAGAVIGSFKEILMLYVLVAIFLLIHAVLKIFYVSKALQKESNVVPLEPY